ncbi:MAG TPA: alpha/beta hydrolase [Kofleriaceae bacterium]|nr:alpha/beta hydrolase [Kofleriaceae bacterium]
MQRIAQSRDGEPLAYQLAGPAGRTPLLTVHGLVSSIQHWCFFTPHFAAQRPVVSWEYRGHGGQPAPRDHRSASVAQFADDAHSVWAAAGVGPSVIVGLSFGVQVALELWRRHPEAVRALVLICGTAGHPLDRVSSSPTLRRAAAAIVRRLGDSGIATPLLAFLRSSAGRRFASELAYLSGGAHREACPRDVLDDLFGHVGNLPPPLLAEVTASYLEHDAFDVLPTITVPTLILAGDRDQLTPVSIAERMHAAIPGSELVVFPGHTHLVQVEQPAAVHAAIESFLADHGL